LYAQVPPALLAKLAVQVLVMSRIATRKAVFTLGGRADR
jgi:hypothetical protein